MDKPLQRRHTIDPKPVLQEWVWYLPLMQQSVLLSSVRGCDGIPKRHKSKNLVKWYRRCILISAFDRDVLKSPIQKGGGSFTGPIIDIELSGDPETDAKIAKEALQKAADDFLDSRDELPAHYQTHFMHSAEILGYKHPDESISTFWANVYFRMAHALHLWPETEEQMDKRLGDDIFGWLDRADESASCSD